LKIQDICDDPLKRAGRAAFLPTGRVQSAAIGWKNAQICKPGGSMRNNYGCPVQGTINVLGGKWKVQVIWHLGFGPKRFAQLRDLLAPVSEKVLAAQLRQLETDGVVDREITPTSPPKVTYSLSAAGQELIAPMNILCGWGTRHLGIPANLPLYPKPGEAQAGPAG
jgi:DNA-binding HxlR family transcriptional regulator